MQIPPTPAFETVPLGGASSVSVRRFRLRAFTRPWHQHPEVELTWILRGEGLRYVGDSVEPFGAGDFCLIGAGLPHAWISSGAPGSGAHSLVLQVDPCRFGAEFLQLPDFAQIRKLFARADRGLVFPGANPRPLFDRILSASSPMGRLAATLEGFDALASAADARELSLAAWNASPRRMRSQDRLGRVMAEISARTTTGLPQRDAASIAGLTPAAFSRFFRRAVGKTYQCYSTEVRLGRAARLLLETDLTVGEIAFEAGFGSLSNFNRAFRAARDFSPREFRRRFLSPGNSPGAGL